VEGDRRELIAVPGSKSLRRGLREIPRAPCRPTGVAIIRWETGVCLDGLLDWDRQISTLLYGDWRYMGVLRGWVRTSVYMDKRAVNSILSDIKRPLFLPKTEPLAFKIFDQLVYLRPPTNRGAEREHTVCGEDAEQDRDRLAQADSRGARGPAEDERGEEACLNAVRLVVLNTVPADGVYSVVSN